MDQMKELLMSSDQVDAWKALEAKFIQQYEEHWMARQNANEIMLGLAKAKTDCNKSRQK